MVLQWGQGLETERALQITGAPQTFFICGPCTTGKKISFPKTADACNIQGDSVLANLSKETNTSPEDRGSQPELLLTYSLQDQHAATINKPLCISHENDAPRRETVRRTVLAAASEDFESVSASNLDFV